MSDTETLNPDTITFGKHTGSTLQLMLRDRQYCKWLIKQEWFKSNYEYLYNRVKVYDPLSFFIKLVIPVELEEQSETTKNGFMDTYKFFNLRDISNLNLKLSESDMTCYEYYLKMINELKTKIEERIDTDNPFDIKAPSKWLLRFEKTTEIKRSVFKEFIYAHELPNIPYIVERIKKEGGIEYKGAQSFNIAKKRSLEQEEKWEKILKGIYGEDISSQFSYNKCIFDFLHIKMNMIFECKLGLKDFDLPQYIKYKTALEKYRIVYLIGMDAIINMEERVIYTSDVDKYTKYQYFILIGKHTSKFDEEIKEYAIVELDTTDLTNNVDELVATM